MQLIEQRLNVNADMDPAGRLELHKVRLSKSWNSCGFSQWFSQK